MHKRPLLSIITTNKNDNYHQNQLQRTKFILNYLIYSLKKMNAENKVEYLIVDWGSNEPFSNYFYREISICPSIKFINIPKEETKKCSLNFDVSRATNIGIDKCLGEYVMLTSSDQFLPLSIFNNLLSLLEKPELYGLTGEEFKFVPRKFLEDDFCVFENNFETVNTYLKSLKQTMLPFPGFSMNSGGGAGGLLLKKNQLIEIGGIKDFNTEAIVGNQQASPVNALVEKLVNCGDSALMLRCKQKKIEINSSQSPNSTREAIESFFGIDQGKWINNKGPKTREIAEIYCNLVASGDKGKGSKPNYTIIDRAEGQSPDDFSETFLTLSRGIKNKIKFVQGKFGMGSTGVLKFCKGGIQLILSKKHPDLLNGHSQNEWGFTVTRQVEPEGEYRNSRWMYLVINESVPSFDSDTLDLLPKTTFNDSKFSHGSFIKLYNYEIGRFRTMATLDLFYELNKRLINPVVPVKIHEARQFKTDSPQATLYGLETRLESDRNNVIEDNFPTDMNFIVENQKFEGQLYVYKRNQDKLDDKDQSSRVLDTTKYGYGIIFTYNGQNIGELPPQFLSSRGLKYENMKKHILLIVDCSKISFKFAERLMKPDRESIYKNGFTDEIKNEIREYLKNHEGLKQVQRRHRREEASEKIEDQTKQISMYQQLLKNQPLLEKFLPVGGNIVVPNPGPEPEITFEGKKYPTFFDLINPHTKSKPKLVEKDRKPRISIKTDVVNDYLSRYQDPGRFSVYRDNYDITDHSGVSLDGFNGKWRLCLPVQETETMKYSLKVEDSVNLANPFVIEFYISSIPNTPKNNQLNSPKPPSSQKGIKIPNVTFFTRDEYDNFEATDDDLLIVVELQDDEPEYKVNLDNRYIHSYLSSNNEESDVLKEKLKTSMGLLGIVLHGECKKMENDDNFEGTESYIRAYTKKLAPILMFLIRDIGELAS